MGRLLRPGGVPGGANIAYSLTQETAVTFYYNQVTHRVWNTATDQMVTLPGSEQQALGCSDNWKPDCLAPLMEPTGNGTYTYQTAALPEGPTSSRLPSADPGMRITGRTAPPVAPTTSLQRKRTSS